MFDFIRTHQRLMQFLLLLLIVPSFALLGLESYTRMGDETNVVAKVGGQKVTKEELDAAQRQQADRLRQAYGAQFDPRLLDTPEARRGLLDNLIAQKALAVEAARNHLSVSDSSLQQSILQIPELQSADGKFDVERYKALLAAQGMTPTMYEAQLRQEMALQQINAAVQNSAFAPKSLATRLSEINEQQREVQEQLFKVSDYAAKVKVTDEMLQAYYDKSGSRFETPEQVKAEYVVLNAANIASQVSVSDADIKSYYEQNAKRYTTEEQRRASHILITAPKEAPAKERNAAKAKAETLLAQLRKNPGDFAKLAKENSQDPGSAERGGDLDFFGKGMMVKPFEDAAYKLRKGEISDVVESEFGYHIIQVTDVKPGGVRSLEQVKDEIAAEIKKQLAAKKYTEMAETFSNTVYEQADSLKPVADKLGLKIETVSIIGREPKPGLGKDVPYNNAKFLGALFSDEAVRNKHNTEAVEVAPNTLVAGRVVSYQPKTRRPLEEVKPQVRELVLQQEAMALAKKAGEARLAELQTRTDANGFGAAKMVSRTAAGGLDESAFMAVMKADVGKLPAVVGAELPGQGYGVYRINKLAPAAKVDEARRTAEQQQIAAALSQQETLAYIDVLKNRAKTKLVNSPAAPAAAAGEQEAPK
ncbi:SurA N-terminal domain-containing protein|uniref:SurA N-terminal domain-containing protein n=1 Tax=Noviherbaspirillum sp. L7-7A TaxID=2850560 RepID=UPI001C2BADB6|nr:SurA N-terminal domain-containing protein [Noviherbaspirillum sp. L7-7A]MBV0878910.1 SurA N-terminal domain-containing protein [Noviherbaspirillum sp. L7-7A]